MDWHVRCLAFGQDCLFWECLNQISLIILNAVDITAMQMPVAASFVFNRNSESVAWVHLWQIIYLLSEVFVHLILLIEGWLVDVDLDIVKLCVYWFWLKIDCCWSWHESNYVVLCFWNIVFSQIISCRVFRSHEVCEAKTETTWQHSLVGEACRSVVKSRTRWSSR